MSGENNNLILIGPLPPGGSYAAKVMLHTAAALAETHTITCVVDDLAPEPAPPTGTKCLRLRDYEKQLTAHSHIPRLYFIDATPESFFALRLLQRLPGLVIPLSLSWGHLAEPFFRSNHDWPDGYINWLADKYGEDGLTLAKAELVQKRFAPALSRELDLAPLLFEKATGLVAVGAWAKACMAQKGLKADLCLPIPLIPQVAYEAGEENPTVLITEKESPATKQMMADLQKTSARPLIFIYAAPDSISFPQHLAEADIVLVEGPTDFLSIAAISAFVHGKALIIKRSMATMAIPEGTCLLVENWHEEELVPAVAALITLPALKEKIEAAALAYAQQHDMVAQAHALTQLAAEKHVIAPHAAPADTVEKIAQVSLPPAIATLEGPVSLIGAAPAAILLKKGFPKLRLEASPRFATSELASALACKTGLGIQAALARFGYEAPVIKQSMAFEASGEDWANIQIRLKEAGPALCFGAAVPQGLDGTAAISTGTAVESKLKLPALTGRKKDQTEGFIPEAGLYWCHDIAETYIQLIAIVPPGMELSFSLKGSSSQYCVANSDSTQEISASSPVTVKGNALGLVDVKLVCLFETAFHKNLGNTPAKRTRTALAKEGLIMKWCKA